MTLFRRLWVLLQLRRPPNTIETWPESTRRAVAAGIFGVSALIAYAVIVATPYARLTSLRAQNRQLEKDLLAQRLQSASDALQQGAPTGRFGLTESAWLAVQRLPGDAQATDLLKMVGDLAHRHNVVVEALRPAKIIWHENYWSLPVQLRVSGRFQDIVNFTDSVGRAPRLLAIDGMRLTPAERGLLAMSATLQAAYLPAPDSRAEIDSGSQETSR